MRLAILLPVCLLLARPQAAQAAEIRKGSFDAVFAERCPESGLQSIFKRMQHKSRTNRTLGNDYRISEESYRVYVPSDYNTNASYGLLVWISADERGDMPEGWRKLMDKRKLIWVGAHRSGNGHNVPGRRMALALDAVHNAERMYNVDPNRIYVSGISGGGRVASILAIHYPDIFSGGIFIVGVEYWEAIAVTGKPGQAWKPVPRPQAKYLAMAKERGRYVLLTGDNDFNRMQTRDYYEKGYRKALRHTLYIQVPGMGHEMPPAEWYEKAIVFLDTAIR
ncbi:MAG: prolyl oligopeptidase family serine peptidase [Planctomycetota bacterium]|jgi:poly(3-hydroxybutyrate) depolymerase